MGEIGKRRFGHYKGLRALVESRLEPPMRCVLDGIQFSSGCTMGKGNIGLESATDPAVTFEKEGRRLRVALKPGWRERIDREMSKEKEIEQSLFYHAIPESDVFGIDERCVRKGPAVSSHGRSGFTGKAVATEEARDVGCVDRRVTLGGHF